MNFLSYRAYRHTDRQKDTQTDRQTHRHRHTQTHADECYNKTSSYLIIVLSFILLS